MYHESTQEGSDWCNYTKLYQITRLLLSILKTRLITSSRLICGDASFFCPFEMRVKEKILLSHSEVFAVRGNEPLSTVRQKKLESY